VQTTLEVCVRHDELQQALHKTCKPGTIVIWDGWKGADLPDKVYVTHKVSHPV